MPACNERVFDEAWIFPWCHRRNGGGAAWFWIGIDRGENWDCDAANGRYVEKPLPLPNKIRTLSGQIQLDQGYSDGQWDPVANIGFATGVEGLGACNCAGLLARVHQSQPNIVSYYVVGNGREYGIAQSELGRPISFNLTVNNLGLLTATMGKTNPAVKTVRLHSPRHDTLRMTCSTAKVRFIDIRSS